MRVVELEARLAEEGARPEAGHLELQRAGADPVEGLDHRSELGRRHVGAEARHLTLGAAALAHDRLAAFEAGDEGEVVEEGSVERDRKSTRLNSSHANISY